MVGPRFGELGQHPGQGLLIDQGRAIRRVQPSWFANTGQNIGDRPGHSYRIGTTHGSINRKCQRRVPTEIALRVDQSSQAATDAATVMLVRDQTSVEVFLLERHIDSDFVGGAWVFPGGKVDETDTRLPSQAVAGHPPAALVEQVGHRLATALCVAAIRETFEESGVLLAHAGANPVTASDLRSDSYVAARRRLSDRHSKWNWSGWLGDEGLRLDLPALAWWSWWVTPVGVHRRFDTKFFVATLPDDQVPQHDNIETTSSRWASPAIALQAAESGSASIILPTRKNLRQLAQYPNTSSVMAAGANPDFARPRIEPRVIFGEDGQVSVDHESFDRPESV